MKKEKTYNISEKEYARAKRDRQRLLEIKEIAKKLSNITKHIIGPGGTVTEADREIYKMYKSGLTLREIGQRVEKSRTTVMNIIRKFE